MTTHICRLNHWPDPTATNADNPWIGEYPRQGTSREFHFLICLTPEDAAGTPQEREESTTLKVRLKVTDGLLDRRGWKNTSEADLGKLLFAYVVERLKVSGLPTSGEVKLELDSYTENRRFEKGPPYSIDHVSYEEPFDVSGPSRIGFSGK